MEDPEDYRKVRLFGIAFDTFWFAIVGSFLGGMAFAALRHFTGF